MLYRKLDPTGVQPRIGRQEQIIDNGLVSIAPGRNEFKSGDVFQSLLKRLHDRVVVLLFKRRPKKKICLFAWGFGISL